MINAVIDKLSMTGLLSNTLDITYQKYQKLQLQALEKNNNIFKI